MKTPVFQENEPYTRFITRFKVFMMRDQDCNFVLNGEAPEEIVQSTGEKTHEFLARLRENSSKIASWNLGKAKIYSNLYFSVCDTNSRATNVLTTNTTRDGIVALDLLEREYADEAVIKEVAQNLKLIYDNRFMNPGENVTLVVVDRN
ncbi:MAG: hypothetical protein ACK52I_32280 [Pseudomonadota bacterium]